MITVRYYQRANGERPVQAWLMGLADLRARVAAVRRIDRLAEANFGDHKSVGDGVSELRIDVGPGYRVYYAQEGKTVVLLLCAGSKRSQRADIGRAKEYWTDYQRRHA